MFKHVSLWRAILIHTTTKCKTTYCHALPNLAAKSRGLSLLTQPWLFSEGVFMYLFSRDDWHPGALFAEPHSHLFGQVFACWWMSRKASLKSVQIFTFFLADACRVFVNTVNSAFIADVSAKELCFYPLVSQGIEPIWYNPEASILILGSSIQQWKAPSVLPGQSCRTRLSPQFFMQLWLKAADIWNLL